MLVKYFVSKYLHVSLPSKQQLIIKIKSRIFNPLTTKHQSVTRYGYTYYTRDCEHPTFRTCISWHFIYLERMSNAFQPAIDEIKSRIVIKEAEIHPLRVTLNELCKLAGIPEEYPNLSTPGSTTATTTALSWKPDQFFNRPLATCVAEYFEAREACGLERPSSVEEIYQSLVRGGFKFEGSTGNEANTIRAIKISLTKNTAQFVKLPDDSFSLKKWYNVRTPRRTNSTPKTDEQVGDTGLEEAAVDSPENTKTDSTEDKIGE